MSSPGSRFKEIRLAIGLSQEEFGEKIKLSKSGVSAVENDKTFVSFEILRTLFIDCNVNLNYLVAGAGSLFNPPKYEDVKEDILKEVEQMLKDRGL